MPKPPKPTLKTRPKVLHVENFPADLLWRIKTSATNAQLTLRDFVIQTLEKKVAP